MTRPKIHTLSSGLTLFLIHRHRDHWLIETEQRKAFWMLCLFVALVATAAYIAIFSVMP